MFINWKQRYKIAHQYTMVVLGRAGCFNALIQWPSTNNAKDDCAYLQQGTYLYSLLLKHTLLFSGFFFLEKKWITRDYVCVPIVIAVGNVPAKFVELKADLSLPVIMRVKITHLIIPNNHKC